MAEILEFDLTSDDPTPFFDQTLTLDGQDYKLTFAWNSRGAYWALSIETSDGESIVAGQTITIGKDFCARSISVNKPKGLLTALNKSPSIEVPGISELTSRVGLYYFEAAP